MSVAPSHQTDRYARQRLLDWWDQERLAAARVMVAGAGAVGSEVVKNLVLLGVGHLLVVDFDTVELSNLSRGVLFRESHIGSPKAQVLARRAAELNPDVRVEALLGDIEFDVGLQTYAAADVVIGCLDSVNARIALNRLAFRAGTPWINTGIGPSAGEVALYSPESGVCYECGLSEGVLAQRNARYSCGGLAAALPPERLPTTATAAAAIAALAVNEAVVLLHGNGEGDWQSLWPGQRAFFNLSPPGMTVCDVAPDPYCLAHDTWAPAAAGASSLSSTVVDLLASLADSIGPGGELDLGFDLLIALECPECGTTERVLRPAKRVSAQRLACPDCRIERTPKISHVVSGEEPLARLTLRELGIPPGQWLQARGPRGETVIALDSDGGPDFSKRNQNGRPANQPHHSARG